MLFIFLFILSIGIAWFIVVFRKALSAENRSAAPENVADGLLTEMVEFKAIREVAERKVAKLEQLLMEKNGIIVDLEKGVHSGQDHQAQVDSLKQILQAQIEELRQQNRQLRESLALVQKENMDLQTRAYAAQAGSSVKIEVRPMAAVAGHLTVPEAAPSVEVKALPEKAPAREAGQGGGPLSLHDVFSSDGQEKTG